MTCRVKGDDEQGWWKGEGKMKASTIVSKKDVSYYMKYRNNLEVALNLLHGVNRFGVKVPICIYGDLFLQCGCDSCI